MQNTENIIYFNFSYFALRLLGKGLYSNHWTAIAELVANGLDAQASSVKIYINMIDKKNSIIEIFDNGYGMDYQDLAEKYVLIGKDKRDDDKIDNETKQQLMGRKGIGKLAALYMSNKYYLISKTKNNAQAIWCLDASNVKESDVPRLDKLSPKDVNIEAKDEWDKFSTGTMIKLTNVDLTNFGIKTIEGLKARLADFYLLEALHGRIEVAVLMNDKDKIIFEEVKKYIAFKNMCAFYNNSDIDYSGYLAEGVKMTSQIMSINDKSRPVILLDNNEFQVRGTRSFQSVKGGTVEKEYLMKGWVGIHTSISRDSATRNDIEFLRNKAYKPNQLRLYVRKKLAVENFLEYIKNTQAFGNYIEGEISFDILDDNELGDIATSNRQGFVEDDERVVLLINILKPIINYLIRCRIRLGNQVKKEEDAYHEEQKKIERDKRLEEERKRQEEENLRKVAERKKAEAERKRVEAEQEKVEAERKKAEAEVAKAEAEKKAEFAEQKAADLKLNLGSEKKRNIFLMDNLGSDQIEFAQRLHMLKINISVMNKLIKKQVMKLQRNKCSTEDIWESLKTMSYLTARMQAVLAYGPSAIFNTKEELTRGDLFEFIVEYCKTVLYKNQSIIINPLIKDKATCIMQFAPQDIAVILENVVSNSVKHNAQSLYINMYFDDGKKIIDLVDDGDGMKKGIADPNELFEFGKSYTATGTGVGLYNIKRIVTVNLNGTVDIIKTSEKGFKLQIRI